MVAIADNTVLITGAARGPGRRMSHAVSATTPEKRR